jgi:short subunit dehydrogenase-like uncharacterized protein
MRAKQHVAVYGAYGHTGKFVVAELLSRGFLPILCGRDVAKLESLAAKARGLDVRLADVDDTSALDRALSGAVAVINCAGPFARTTDALIEAALRARIPYVDITAEIEVASSTFAQYDGRARDAGIAVLPAMAFYGGLGDLLATAALGDWHRADEVSIAYGLSSWHPTHGTRATSAVSSQRRDGRRLVYADGKLELRTDAAPIGEWRFPDPLGVQAVVGEFTTADTATIARHLHVSAIRSCMTIAAVRDVSHPQYTPPTPVDEQGRSAQMFLVEVVVRRGGDERRATARGQDIYAASAPLVVEAVERLLRDADVRGGVFTAGERFDARDFLTSLCGEHLGLAITP